MVTNSYLNQNPTNKDATPHSVANEPKKTSTLTYHQKLNIDIASGLIAGVLCSGLFNPWDRALYLSVKNNRPFLSLDNFKSPYQGLSQAMVQRAFLSGIYFTIQGELNAYVLPLFKDQAKMSDGTARFYTGMLNGIFSGVLTNPISAIKYQTWGQEDASFISSVKEMWRLGGMRPFLKGSLPTMTRDMVFGSTYELMRHFKKTTPQTQDAQQPNKRSYAEFAYNAGAAALATIVSSPFNYVRNVVYATPPNIKPPSIYQALSHLHSESKQQDNYLKQLSFFQRQLRIGWGTARVAAGMAVGQKLVDSTRNELNKHYKF
ncbi:MAG: hypothetical protein H2069_07825 [Legionella sp.]|nr:hypothetical protein [Legionella sp.]